MDAPRKLLETCKASSRMKRDRLFECAAVLTIALLLFLAASKPAAAHPVPFSYVDVRIASGEIDLTVVAHMYDVAHELSIDPADQLLDASFVANHTDQLIALIRDRLQLTAGNSVLANATWSAPEILADRQSIRFQARYPIAAKPGVVKLSAALFPYDPAHQTFVNFYEDEKLTSQSILDTNHREFDYFVGGRQGVLAVVKKFAPAGIHHILIGPDHILFLVGLLLLGGPMRRLFLIVSAFTVAHSITLSLAALNILTPSPRIIEPAIALSIVYVGVDNLMVGRGRDVRAWIAFAFGFIHGFGFANVLREMNLPTQALGWSLFSFNVGVEIGQLMVVAVVASALMALRSNNEAMSKRVAFAGSVVVILAGAFWFVQRVFFPGGMV